MKKTLTIGVGLAVAFTLGCADSVSEPEVDAPAPAFAKGANSGLDAVVGAGTVPISFSNGQGERQGNLTVGAHEARDGVSYNGSLRVRLPGLAETTADVECLWVDGNRAVAGGPFRAGAPPGADFLYLLVEDNGGVVRGVPQDKAAALLTRRLRLSCRNIASRAFGVIFPIAHGNYKVTDAP